jgi:hypothetical protein
MTIGKRAALRAVAAVTLILTTGLTGCLVAAAAGAGGAIVFSGHTAEAIVERPVADMTTVAEQVLQAEGIEITDSRSEDSGDRRTLKGEKDDLTVTVKIERTDDGTKIGVEAQRDAARWDDDYARTLLARIIA